MKADLHMHTTYSDGLFSPTQLVRKAKQAKLTTIAITDHDCVAGISEAIRAGESEHIEVIAGVEISCGLFNQFRHDLEFHLIGLFIDYEDKNLIETLKLIRTHKREVRMKSMLQRLKEKLGITITFDEIVQINKITKKQLGINQIFEVLIKRGIIKDKFQGQKYRQIISIPSQFRIEEAIELIKNAGGTSILAHPLRFTQKIEPLPSFIEYESILQYLKSKGLKGIEINYPGATFKEQSFLKEIAKKYSFVRSAGTDYHSDQSTKQTKLGEISADIKEMFKCC